MLLMATLMKDLMSSNYLRLKQWLPKEAKTMIFAWKLKNVIQERVLNTHRYSLVSPKPGLSTNLYL